MSDTKTLILEYDDFHWKSPENCLDSLLRFIFLYPNIKISLFTTPRHSGLPLSNNPGWCDKVKCLIESNNIQLAVHGLTHSHSEFKDKNIEDTRNSIIKAEEEFALANLPFVKVFRAPYWGINDYTTEVLEDLNYTHHYIHPENDKLMFESKSRIIKGIYYNWNLKDEAPNDNLLIAHGHSHSTCQNGIGETFNRVSKFIDENNPQFKFVNEIL